MIFLFQFVINFVFFLMIGRTPRSTLFPYTTLFRSQRSPGYLARPFSLTRLCSMFFIMATADRKSTRLNSSHGYNSYAVFCFEKINYRIAAHDHDRLPVPMHSMAPMFLSC